MVAIIGKSGSGKSTLLRCINGLETYDDGNITVDGIDVGQSKDNLRNLRRNVGMVFQQFNLFPHLTAAENVMLAPKVVNRENAARRRKRWRRRCSRRSACPRRPTAIRRSSPAASSSASPLRVRWRCGRMCCCATRSLRRSIPELVNEVLRVVEQLAKDGMTLILVTHEMRFARDVGTKLVFMHQGKVHEEGPPKQLFAKPRTPELAQFVGMQH